MILLKIIIVMSIIIGCTRICYFISYLLGRRGVTRPGKAGAIIPVFILSILGCIPTYLYLPYMPFVPKGVSETIGWILVANLAMNMLGSMQGVENGLKKRIAVLDGKK